MNSICIILLLSWSSKALAWLRFASDSTSLYQGEINVQFKMTNRTKRSLMDNRPDKASSIDLSFYLEGEPIVFHLIPNSNLHLEVPIITYEYEKFQQKKLTDTETTTFYQDRKFGSSFVIQKGENGGFNMIGCFQGGNEWYSLQSKDQLSLTTSENHIFDIRKEKIVPLNNDAISLPHARETIRTHLPSLIGYRQKRASGTYSVELLMVSDYSVYKYWYDLSTEVSPVDKESDAIKSIRQYYAFVINGMDAAYKNIQTSTYIIDVVFAGLVITKTKTDSTWTESIKKNTTPRPSVESGKGLDNFRVWVGNNLASLPASDHAMLFTKYDLTRNGSSSVVGLASLGAICGPSSQSIIEDQFEFQIITTTSHELGHSLGSDHDDDGNACKEHDGYIMASVSTIHTGSTATNPWKFSPCSTHYFTTKINSLDSTNTNCLTKFGPKFDPTALKTYDNQLPGQVYDADEQCKRIHGNGSYLCRGPYKGDYTSLCNNMYCSDPKNKSICHGDIPGDGTICGDKKWCIAGVCKLDTKAPKGNGQCLYGDKVGAVFSSGETCVQAYQMNPFMCLQVGKECCYTCSPTTTTTIPTSKTTVQTTSTTTIPSTSTTTVPSTSTTTMSTSTTPIPTTPTTTFPSTPTTSVPTTSTTTVPTTSTAMWPSKSTSNIQTLPSVTNTNTVTTKAPSMKSILENIPLPVLIGGGVGALLLIVLNTIMCCCCCRGQSARNKVRDVENASGRKLQGKSSRNKVGVMRNSKDCKKTTTRIQQRARF